ncbi:MAG: methyltransferase [Erysipelotrichaceae bacterium]
MSHYFKNDVNVKHQDIVIKERINDIDFVFHSDNGVFSKSELDYGSLALLNVLFKESIDGALLDVGCGIGLLGVVLKKKFADVCVDMIDVNDRALELAKINARTNGVVVNVYSSDVYSDVIKKYDIIITNPPIRAGKQVVLDILVNSRKYLNDDGCLYFVMRKSHGAPSTIKRLKEVFPHVDILDRDKGFYVICAK